MLANRIQQAAGASGLDIDNVLYLHDKATNRLKAYDIQTDTYIYDASITGYDFNGAIDKDGNAYIHQPAEKVAKVDIKGVITVYTIDYSPNWVFVDDNYFYVFNKANQYFGRYNKADGSKVGQVGITNANSNLWAGLINRNKTRIYFTTSDGSTYRRKYIDLAAMQGVTVVTGQWVTYKLLEGTAMLPNENIVQGSSSGTNVFSPTTETTIYSSESAADCYSDTIHVFFKLDTSNPRIRRFNPNTLAQIDTVTIPNATTAGGYLGMVELKDYIATMVQTSTTYINICKKSDFTSVKSITLGGYSYMYRYR